MFALPLEVKQLNKSNSYMAHEQFTDVAYESIAVKDASNPESVERFARNLWPEGNQKFCNTVTIYAQKALIVEQIVERMIFQSLGIEKYCNSHLESVSYGLRFAAYGGLPIQEAKVSLPAHVDPILMNVIRQNGVEGLEVYTKNGECIRVVPSPDTFTVIIGEAMMVLTNGRFDAPVHSVSINEKRYSLLLGSLPKEGYLIQPIKEIVDENHPLQFYPCNVHKYMEFKYSPQGLTADNPLKAFCGAQDQQQIK
jgi:isopenicillin N synthase-like dioxygenase